MQVARVVIAVACLPLVLVMPRAAAACGAPAKRDVYSIHHQTYGNIGSHILTFQCEGKNLVVETEVTVDVKVLFVTVYKRRGRYREVWREGQLISYDAWTNEAGDEYVTKARIEGDHLVIAGSQPDVRVPLDTVPSHPWNADVVERPLLFGMKDGRLLKVDVQSTGYDEVKIGETTVRAKKYSTDGDINRELWYDLQGNWLRWRINTNGNIVDIIKQ